MLNGQDCWRLIFRSSFHFLSLRSSRAMQLFPPFHNQDSKTEIWAALFCHLSFFHFKSQQPYFPRWSIHNLMKSWGTGTQDIFFTRITLRQLDMTSSPTVSSSEGSLGTGTRALFHMKWWYQLLVEIEIFLSPWIQQWVSEGGAAKIIPRHAWE